MEQKLTIDVYAFLGDVTDCSGPVVTRDGKPWRFNFDPIVMAGTEYHFPACIGTVRVFSRAALPTTEKSVNDIERVLGGAVYNQKPGLFSALRSFGSKLARGKELFSFQANPAM